MIKMVEAYTDYVREIMLAKAQATLALEQAAQAASGSHTSGTSFSGYAVDYKGTTLYLDATAPLLAYATRGPGPEAAPAAPNQADSEDADDSARATESTGTTVPMATAEEGTAQHDARTNVACGR